MRTPQTILIILFIYATLNVFGQNNSKDTVFIYKDSLAGTSQSIFLDNSKNSEFYESITNFKFQQFDKESYKNSLDYLKNHKLKLTKKKPVIPWTKWVILKQYKHSFYAYKPCDFNSHFRISLNDTTFIDWTGEGPEANKIVEQKKIDDKTYEFTLKGVQFDFRKLIIHIIDSKKGIAIFEQTTDENDKLFYLMIDAENINSVPIIINKCDHYKQTELHFDKPDYSGLLILK